MQSTNKQETANVQVTATSLDSAGKEGSAERIGCHMADKDDSQECIDEQMAQVDKARFVCGSDVVSEEEIKTDQLHEEVDCPYLGIKQLSVDDHLPINQRPFGSENLHCTSLTECLDKFSSELTILPAHTITIPLSETENQGICDPSCTKCTLCYIISPLVCLSHTRLVREYFTGKHHALYS